MQNVKCIEFFQKNSTIWKKQEKIKNKKRLMRRCVQIFEWLCSSEILLKMWNFKVRHICLLLKVWSLGAFYTVTPADVNQFWCPLPECN